jgi:molybdopterin-guanine dinucleotide biosynthesis protein A
MKNAEAETLTCEICILAGGMSTRMGRDKATMRLGAKTMVGHVRAVARLTGLKVRIIRKDLVPRCGPLGGIYTALKTTRANTVLFLACDMPFVTVDLLNRVIKSHAQSRAGGSVFVVSDDMPSFPFMLPREAIVAVEKQISKNRFSMHALASTLKAKRLRVGETWRSQLRNINSLADVTSADKQLRQKR